MIHSKIGFYILTFRIENYIEFSKAIMKISFEKSKTLPGTRMYHHFVPQSKCKISYKITSDEENLSGSFNLYDKKISGIRPEHY